MRGPAKSPGPAASSRGVAIRPVRADDLAAVTALDKRNTGVAKAEYWRDLYQRYAQSVRPRYFLVADENERVRGFVIGEVRAWEFGSEPCGWVFAIQVEPEARLRRVASALLDAIAVRFKNAGAGKIRTMLRRDDNLIMSFFRSQGMMAGPFLQLEKALDDAGGETQAGEAAAANRARRSRRR